MCCDMRAVWTILRALRDNKQDVYNPRNEQTNCSAKMRNRRVNTKYKCARSVQDDAPSWVGQGMRPPPASRPHTNDKRVPFANISLLYTSSAPPHLQIENTERIEPFVVRGPLAAAAADAAAAAATRQLASKSHTPQQEAHSHTPTRPQSQITRSDHQMITRSPHAEDGLGLRVPIDALVDVDVRLFTP